MDLTRLRCVVAKLRTVVSTLAENLAEDFEDVLPDIPALNSSKTFLIDEETFDLMHTMLGVEYDVPYLADAVYSSTQAQERIRLLTELGNELVTLDKPGRPRFRAIIKALALEIKFLKASLLEDPTNVPGFDYTTYRALLSREQEKYRNVGRPRSPFTEMIGQLKALHDPTQSNEIIVALIDRRARQLRPHFDQGESLDRIKQIISAECDEVKKEDERQEEYARQLQTDTKQSQLVSQLLSVFDAPRPNMRAHDALIATFGTREGSQRWLAESNRLKAEYNRRRFDRATFGQRLLEIYKRVIEESGDFTPIFAMVHSVRRLKAFLNR